jgi:hypothetical protein
MVCGLSVLMAACLVSTSTPVSAAPRQRQAAPPWPLSALFQGAKVKRSKVRRSKAKRRDVQAAQFQAPAFAPWPRPRPHPEAKPSPVAPPPPAVQPPSAEAPRPVPKPSPETQSACRVRLAAGLAVAAALPPISGPGECGASDPVRLEAILTPGRRRIVLTPPAVLDCEAAESVARWVRDEASRAFAPAGPQLAGIKVAASFDCRGRNRIAGAQISQHGYGKALDVSAFTLSDGSVLGLADPAADRTVRESLRGSACARFTTVLGPGSDGYHESHVHFDVIVRRSGYRICQWDVR